MRGKSIHTRNVGKARIYKLNRENPQVEKFIDYSWSVVNSEVDKELNKEEILVQEVNT